MLSEQILSMRGRILVSATVMVIYIAALAVAFLSKNDNMLMVLIGVAATNATTVVGYWVGSSSGSTKKDDALIAKQPEIVNPKVAP